MENNENTTLSTNYVDYRHAIINIPWTDEPTVSAYYLLYECSHKLTLDMDETTVLLNMLIKENL